MGPKPRAQLQRKLIAHYTSDDAKQGVIVCHVSCGIQRSIAPSQVCTDSAVAAVADGIFVRFVLGSRHTLGAITAIAKIDFFYF